MAWSRFYGTVRGKGVKEATQQGTADSGLRVVAATKDNGSLTIELIGMHDGRDKFSVTMGDHGSSSVWKGVLAEGFMGTDAREALLPTPTIESFSDEALIVEMKRRFGPFEILPKKAKVPA
jgi:hypothetical protein